MLQTTIPAGLIGLLAGVGLAQAGGPPSMLPKSPLRGVSVRSWVIFTTRLARHPRGHVTSRGQLGTFGLDPRRLVDVGLAASASKTDVGGTGKWAAAWKSPSSEAEFLGSLPLQYEAFKRSCLGLSEVVGDLVGTEVDGTRCSLSGLLGAGHAAGAASVRSWVKNPAERAKFLGTTTTFKLTNGIF